jgi:FkbM family methyltransferase
VALRSKLSGVVVANQRALSSIAWTIAVGHGFRIEKETETWLLKRSKDKKILRVSKKDLQYIQELTANFDFLFDSVNYKNHNDWKIVDFSKSATHQLAGWPFFEVIFPSFAEPTSTTDQYIEFLKLDEGQNVIDLGAYAGISSMQFQEVVGISGSVVAIEADPLNAECTNQNLDKYFALRGVRPMVIEAAGWSTSGVLDFSAEGNVGSAVTEISNRTRDSKQVRSITLSEIMKVADLNEISAIKADIEGAEAEVFKDSQFFQEFHPKIIFEGILKGSRGARYRSAMHTLELYGYQCQVIEQFGSQQVLIGAY